MKHKDRAFGGPEGLEHGEHGDGDTLGELDVVSDIWAGEQRLGKPGADVILTPPGHRPEPVQGLAGDDPDQVRAWIAYLGQGSVADVGPPQPGLLHHILGVGGRAEHLVGDGEEQAAVSDERVGRHAAERYGERAEVTRRREPL